MTDRDQLSIADWLQARAHWPLLITTVTLIAFHLVRTFDFSRDQSEGAMMMVTERFSGGMPAMSWVDRAPYTVTPYGPGYFVLTAAVNKLTAGIPLLVTGRLVSLLASIGVALTLGLMIRRTHTAVPAFGSAVAYLGYPGIGYWSHDYRVDALATLFAVGAYVALGKERSGVARSALLVVVGSLVKQTVALAAVPMTLHLFITGRRREAIRYVVLIVVGGLAVWTALIWLTDGYYLSIALLGNRRIYSPERILRWSGEFLRNPVTIAGLLAVGFAALKNPREVWRCRFVTALLVSGLFGALISGAEESAENYFLEAAAMLALAIGVWLVSPSWKYLPRTTAVLAWLGGTVLTIALVVRIIQGLPPPNPPDLTSFHNALRTPGVLVDPPYISAAVREGLHPLVNDPVFYRIAARNKAIDTRLLLDDLGAGHVSGLILFTPLDDPDVAWPADITAFLRSHFQPFSGAGRPALYRYSGPD